MDKFFRSNVMRKNMGIMFLLFSAFLFLGTRGTMPSSEVPMTSTQIPATEEVATGTLAIATPAATPSVSLATKVDALLTATTKTTLPMQGVVYYPIVRVVDGDTVSINIDGVVETIRLIGIDTPETVDPRKTVQCFGIEASNKAKELLTGKKVRIEKDPTQGERDKYGRLLAYLYREDGLFFNEYMIKEGYAHEYTYVLPYKYQTEFQSMERSARSGQLGLWAPSACNGVTTSGPTTQAEPAASAQTAGGYYTSSYYSSKYYYPAACAGWQSLSPKYLKNFDTVEALLATYPSRTRSPGCP